MTETEDVGNWSCYDCPLNKKRAVRGRGNKNAGIWFVGEAPGREEEANGVPFVGPSGKVLQLAIDRIGLKEGEYYITNLVRCRPTDIEGRNRSPTKIEKKQCGGRLEEEIAKYGPSVIVLLGNHVVKYFLHGKDVSSMSKAGQYTYDSDREVVFFIMPHPATVLYNPSLKAYWEAVFEKISDAVVYAVQRRLGEGEGEERPW